MNAFWGPLEFFLITGNYLLFWPFYCALHRTRTRRRRALQDLFVLEACVYCFLTGLFVLAIYITPDFHHGGFLLAELLYLLLLVGFWIATYGVWADNPPDLEP
ncbi:MAG TPA: hypothetical protein VKY92_19260 [Verrucomicrobiae bacterium]|nr:hypothetical protein [Verrucomicrobiae bacterium]